MENAEARDGSGGQVGSSRSLVGRMNRSIFTLLLVALCGHVATPSRAQPDSAAKLSCPNGLIVHRYAPESPEAKVLRMRSGVELRASQERLLTITGSMVDGAIIWGIHQYDTPEERDRRTPTRTSYGVSLRLNQTGADQFQKVMAQKGKAEFVVVCNDVVLIAWPVGKERLEAVDVLLDDTVEAAEQFARSFTPHVRFEPRTPAPE